MALNEFCRMKTTESLRASSKMIESISGIEKAIIDIVLTTNDKVIA
jgi:hypothetical protein